MRQGMRLKDTGEGEVINMGGRGAASGISDKGKPYGTEYTTLLKVSNVKFVQYNDSSAAKAPMETMTRGRIYVTVKDNKPKIVTYYDNVNKRSKSIDLTHKHDGKIPHVHHGYNHDEGGTTNLTPQEKKIVDFVHKVWYNRNSK